MSTRVSWEGLLLYLRESGLEVCRRTVERWMNLAENPFPRPIIASPRKRYFLIPDVDRWLRQREKSSRLSPVA